MMPVSAVAAAALSLHMLIMTSGGSKPTESEMPRLDAATDLRETHVRPLLGDESMVVALT
jgi:hypothetical protein